MIEINLLPEELRVKRKSPYKGIDPKQVLYAAPIVFGALIIIHIFLACLFVVRSLQLSSLDNKWQKLAPERKNTEEFQKKHALLSADIKTMQQLINQRISWSDKLNKLSLYLPDSVWFNEISSGPKDFSLKASVVSFEKDELSQINKFIDGLKNDARFLKDFSRLELSTVQRKSIGGYDIIDFVLEGNFKQK